MNELFRMIEVGQLGRSYKVILADGIVLYGFRDADLRTFRAFAHAAALQGYAADTSLFPNDGGTANERQLWRRLVAEAIVAGKEAWAWRSAVPRRPSPP